MAYGYGYSLVRAYARIYRLFGEREILFVGSRIILCYISYRVQKKIEAGP